MSTIVTRAGKGSALTWTEGDANITNLNNDKLENITNESIGDLSDVDLTGNANGYVLTYNSTSGNFEVSAPSAGGISNLVEDTTPQLGGTLDGQSNTVQSINIENYRETVYDLGAVSTSTTINLANGNVQTYTNDGFTFNGFTGATSGMSVTLVSGAGTDMSGMFNVDGGLAGNYYIGNNGSNTMSMTGTNIISIAYIGTKYYISIAQGYM